MSVKISRILHAGYVFESGDTKIAFDPIFENPFSRNCHAFPAIEFDTEAIRALRFQAVFISHYHDDHCSLESLNLINRETPIYIFCLHEEMLNLIRELGFTRVTALTLDQPIHVGDFEIVPKRALDEDVDSIFHIKARGRNILNVVDSWIDDEVLADLSQHTWDVILWPFQTMREIEVIAPANATPAERTLPQEWVDQLHTLQPKIIVPSSCQFKLEDWSWYNDAFFPISYAQFQKEISVALPSAMVRRLDPGCTLSLGSVIETGDRLPWITPVGDQNVDYVFEPNRLPTPTSDIAGYFSPLTNEQRQVVNDYVTETLPLRFAELDESDERYFRAPARWQLSIFEHDGSAQTFEYIIERQQCRLHSPSETHTRAEWRTEVPIAKLYAALEMGESLTSMYVRVNAPADSDIVEDPLIRCLFTGVFGAYQRAQLESLQGR